MSLSNPATEAARNAGAYVDSVLKLLGDQPPLEVLERLLPSLERELHGFSEAELRRPEAEGKWSILEVVMHLADTELVTGYRIRLTLAQDEPELTGFDQGLWADRLSYRDALLSDAVGQLGALRGINLVLYRSLGSADLRRAGRHSERGPETVQRMLELSAGHDLVHLRQIGRIKQVLEQEPAGLGG